jgi:hypothetical protein
MKAGMRAALRAAPIMLLNVSIWQQPIRQKIAPEDRPVLSWENYTGAARGRLVIGLLSNRLAGLQFALAGEVDDFRSREAVA